ncbi:MAG: hypothetical protein O6844_06245 [Gammaproteobacteria bacterium]|nr:hypothetical protein [Gammaproteobacteria bacterium]MCZ6827221.1 hypothetical protein [Gammaproteobacteria bacterium]MCZ6911251.1 hypothetical protein [Pseudomonadota bacterium]
MLYWLPLLVGLLPTLLVCITYLISASHEQVPWCLPIVDGCTSISRASRNPPAIFLFRAVMLPLAVLLMIYWVLSLAWLRWLCSGIGRRPSIWLAVIGCAGAALLVLYVTFLGSEGAIYQLLRRFGASSFYGLSFLAQLIQVHWLITLNRKAAFTSVWLPVALFWLAMVMLIAGLASVAISGVGPSYEYNNIAQWNFTLMLNAHFVLCAWGWRESGFSLFLGAEDI